MSHSLGAVEPSGCGTALLSVFAVDADEWTCYCLEARGGGGRGGSPIWGRPQRPKPSVCVCVHAEMHKCVCAGIKSIMQTVFSPLFFLSLVPLMNNELIVDCGVKCQLSVCLYVTCHFDGSRFPPSFSQPSPFVFVKVFICSQCGSSPQQEPLRKLIDHSHFSCCAADMHSIWPNYCCFHCNDGLCMCIFIFF